MTSKKGKKKVQKRAAGKSANKRIGKGNVKLSKKAGKLPTHRAERARDTGMVPRPGVSTLDASDLLPAPAVTKPDAPIPGFDDLQGELPLEPVTQPDTTPDPSYVAADADLAAAKEEVKAEEVTVVPVQTEQKPDAAF